MVEVRLASCLFFCFRNSQLVLHLMCSEMLVDSSQQEAIGSDTQLLGSLDCQNARNTVWIFDASGLKNAGSRLLQQACTAWELLKPSSLSLFLGLFLRLVIGSGLFCRGAEQSTHQSSPGTR